MKGADRGNCVEAFGCCNSSISGSASFCQIGERSDLDVRWDDKCPFGPWLHSIR
jgi:hypothetical protein